RGGAAGEGARTAGAHGDGGGRPAAGKRHQLPHRRRPRAIRHLAARGGTQRAATARAAARGGKAGDRPMKPRAQSKSVRRKLFAGVLLTSLVALLICGVGLFAYDLHAYRDTSATELAVEAELLGHVTAAALQFDDRASAAQNVAFLKARPNIRAAAVFTPGGSLFASYAREGVQASEIPGAPGAEGVAIHGDTVAVFHRITFNNEVIGSIYLAEDLKMYDRIWSYTAIVLAVILVALLVSAILSTWLQRSITTPIIEISAL